jgi:glutaredoxin
MKRVMVINIILYSNNCPKCKILKTKLVEKNIQYLECNNVKLMLSKGIRNVPYLQIDEELYNFSSAVQWVSNHE